MFKYPKQLLERNQAALDRSLSNTVNTGIHSSRQALKVWNEAFEKSFEPKLGSDKFMFMGRKCLWIEPVKSSTINTIGMTIINFSY